VVAPPGAGAEPARARPGRWAPIATMATATTTGCRANTAPESPSTRTPCPFGIAMECDDATRPSQPTGSPAAIDLPPHGARRGAARTGDRRGRCGIRGGRDTGVACRGRARVPHARRHPHGARHPRPARGHRDVCPGRRGAPAPAGQPDGRRAADPRCGRAATGPAACWSAATIRRRTGWWSGSQRCARRPGHEGCGPAWSS
jgi:hypothetical protein